jgi:uncharacterized protein (DUF1800 family)
MSVLPVLAMALMFAAAVWYGPASTSAQAAPKQTWTQDERIVHLLNRIGYGPRPGDVERVKAEGVQRYLDEQLHPERIVDGDCERRLTAFHTWTMSPLQLAYNYPTKGQIKRLEKAQQEGKDGQAAALNQMIAPEAERGNPRDILLELSDQRLVRAVHSERQLNEVMVNFWMNHFNIYWQKGQDRNLVTSFERDVIRPRAFGKFRDLLLATAESPAMMFYLDNYLSNGGPVPVNAKRKSGLNENYAREIMELHTLGVDGGYSQKDVVELARCFTGWSVQRPRDGEGFEYRSRMHDDGQKVVLGHVFPPGQGMQDGIQAIDLLARNPHTAHFISLKLCRHFVCDDPPKALVDRTARVFMQTDGDIREVVRSILTSSEFNSPQYYRAKIKTPFELVVSSIRAVGGSTSGGRQIFAAFTRMGMPPYLCQPPTGYADVAQAWVSAGALLERLNFEVAMMGGKMPGVEVDPNAVFGGQRPADAQADVHVLVQRLLGGDCSTQTSETLREEAVNANPAKLIALVLGSPEFQRR